MIIYKSAVCTRYGTCSVVSVAVSFAIFVVLFVLAAHSDDALYVCYGILYCVVTVQYSTVQ